MRILSAVLVVACASSPMVNASTNVQRLKQEAVVDYLFNSRVVYDSPRDAAFALRVVSYERGFECERPGGCLARKLVFLTSTFDEDPDQAGFEAALDGALIRLGTVKIPSSETSAFEFEAFTSGSRGEVCHVFKVALATVSKAPCSGSK